MPQTIPLSRLSTAGPSAPYNASFDSPDDPEDLRNDHADEFQNMKPSWNKDLYMLLEQPTSSQAAFLVHVFTTFLISFSAVITVLETVPAFHSISGSFWFGLETTLVVLFTLEYIGRCIAHGTSWKRLFNWLFCECPSNGSPLQTVNSHCSSVPRDHRSIGYIAVLY